MAIKATSSGTKGKFSNIGFELSGLLCGLRMVLKIGNWRKLFSLKPVNYIVFGYKPHRNNRTAVTKTAFGATLFAPAISRTYTLKYEKDRYIPDLSIHSKQPAASVKNVKAGSWVNLRSVPSLSGAVAGKLYNGDAVTVLGETAGNWCYVKTGSLLGYVMTDYLSIGGSVSPGEPSSKGYTMLLYTDVPNNNSSVKIQYPKFTGAGFDALNALIYSKVKGFVLSGNTGLTIDYQAAVTLKHSKIVSIVFWGSSYISGGAHPFTDLIALNVDLSSMREITFADLYDTDNGFEDVFFEKAFFPTNPVTSYKASSFSEMLKLQEPENQSVSPFGTPDNVSCFLKPDGIVLSMSAVHATGSDHFEAQLKYSDIQQFYRLGQKYWEN
jgi:hypothetical protein